MGDWYNPFDDEPGSGFNGGVATFATGPVGLGIYGARKGYEALKGMNLSGATDYQPGLWQVPSAVDADNPAIKAWKDGQDAAYEAQFKYLMKGLPVPPELQARIDAAPKAPPTDAEIQAASITQDRARILGVDKQYGDYTAGLQLAAQGQGPSAAEATLREGAARNTNQAYGMAASGNVMPGQRAALVGQAITAQGAANQGTARDAAVLKAQETSGARGQLGSALAGRAQTLGGLYAGTEQTNEANQAAGIKREETMAGIQQTNAQERGAFNRQLVSTAGAAATHISDIRAKEDIVPMHSGLSQLLFPGTKGGANKYMATPPPQDALYGKSQNALYRRPTPILQTRQPVQMAPAVRRRAGTVRALPVLDESLPAFSEPSGEEAPDQGAVVDQYSADTGARSTDLQYDPKTDSFVTLSDERSKERIRDLEGRLAAATGGQAKQIRDTNAEYPMATDRGRGPSVAPTDLVFSSEDGGNFRTPDEQLRFAESRRRRPEPTPLFFGNDNGGTFRTPVEQARYSEDLRDPRGNAAVAALATRGGSRRALGPVEPYEYRYKPEFAAQTGDDMQPRAGVMAQDLAQSPNPALRSAVVKTPLGLGLDANRAISSSLAMNAGLDKRLRDIEAALKMPTAYPETRPDLTRTAR